MIVDSNQYNNRYNNNTHHRLILKDAVDFVSSLAQSASASGSLCLSLEYTHLVGVIVIDVLKVHVALGALLVQSLAHLEDTILFFLLVSVVAIFVLVVFLLPVFLLWRSSQTVIVTFR